MIATPDNGALQQISDGETGLITPYNDPAAAADRILRLIADPALRARLGGTLRARVEAQFSVAAVAPLWRDLIETVAAERTPHLPQGVMPGFWMGGFECSSHRLRSGRRVDVIAATGHDARAAEDYRELGALGLTSLRDGLRWPLIETAPGRYDWSSWLPMLRAARGAKAHVVWDLLHYGLPDGLDIWRPEFVTRFAAFARAAALVARQETESAPHWCPVNEISFFSWGGGDAGYLNPFAHGRGYELKVQLARAAILGMEEMLAVDPRARFLHCEPAINVVCDPARPGDAPFAEGHRQAQFQAFDLIAGRSWPQIGGREGLLDLVGVNYYFNNQWVHGGPVLDIGHPLYKPVRLMLAELAARYDRPLVIAETGIEGDRRAGWLAYMGQEAQAALRLGVPLEGLCLYPVMDHPGWDDGRECPNGLVSRHLEAGRRRADPALTVELARQQGLLAARLAGWRAAGWQGAGGQGGAGA